MAQPHPRARTGASCTAAAGLKRGKLWESDSCEKEPVVCISDHPCTLKQLFWPIINNLLRLHRYSPFYLILTLSFAVPFYFIYILVTSLLFVFSSSLSDKPIILSAGCFPQFWFLCVVLTLTTFHPASFPYGQPPVSHFQPIHTCS